MRSAALCAFLALAGCAGWGWADVAGQAAVTGLLAADCVQATSAQAQWPRWTEDNPVQGPHPGPGGQIAYSVVAAALHWNVARRLEYPWRWLWHLAWAAVEVRVVVYQARQGLP